MKYLLCLLLVVAGCGQAGSTATNAHDADKQAADDEASKPQGVGGHGAICDCREHKGCKPVNCAEGLECAYACGIPGCVSTCLTPEEAANAHNIP